MSLFCSILQKHYNLDVILPENADYYSYWALIYKNKRIKETLEYYIYHYITKLYIKTQNFQCNNNDIIKFRLRLLKLYLDNPFFTLQDKKIFFNCFTKSHRTYNAFSRFAHIFRCKIAPTKIKSDLLLNEINPSKKNVFVLFQKKDKFLFIINDLIKIINHNLSNCSYFYAEPLSIKNPYNNVQFNNTILYNIYFFIRNNIFHMPILFELFYQCEFNLDLFRLENENYIRDIYIKNYIVTSNFSLLHSSILDMLSEHKKSMNKIKIHKKFPKEKLVNIMRPYLHLYLMSKYLVSGSEKRSQSSIMLKKKLHKFSKFNPSFGRKILTVDKNINIPFRFKKRRACSIVDYDMNCISFYETNILSQINNNNYDSSDDSDISDSSFYDSDDESVHTTELHDA